jgi:putative mRNA 3-end processing factor
VHSAGHIPGAAMFEILGHDTTLFTGDLNTLSTRLVYGAQPVKCDTLIMESTYAGRNHPERMKLEFQFVQKIKEVVSRGGVAILPSFAVGRTQEILLILRGQKFDVKLDGMGASVNRIYLKWPEYLRSAKKLKAAIRRVDVVRKARDRTRADADVIITTSGMLDGGPVIDYLQRMKDDAKSAVLLTGYQVEGTNGRKLMDGGMINLYGTAVKVNTGLEFFDFSAHAGHDDLLRFIDGCDPKRVILMHGDNRDILAKDIQGREVILPKEGELLEI